MTSLDAQVADLVRAWAMDAPRAANSGHSGTAMALAPLAAVLYGRVMEHDPADPQWPDRDRFVLSAGHASILQYSYLHLSGYDLGMDDLQAFRQWGSRTPGHPEVRHTHGVEVTTGPLGQGFANAVGMALAERFLRAQFGEDLVDHHTYVIVSDGDLQEGLSHEAASLAGHLGLGRLVVVYDDNRITIDGSTDLSSSDNPALRFAAYGWDVQELGEAANDLDALEAALRRAKADEHRPSLLVLRSHIGYPAPTWTDSHKAHGEPFPPEEIAAAKERLGLPTDQAFYSPAEVVEPWRAAVRERGARARADWQARLDAFTGNRAAWDAAWAGTGLPGWDASLPTWAPGEKVATRQAVNTAIVATQPLLPGLVAGSADLTGNTGVKLAEVDVQSREHPGGRQVHYGIREHAMGAMANGMALHGGVLPVVATFFVFSDYLRPTLRLAAIARAKSIFVFTHDSVGVGEDGPTHQPVEHLAALRAIPGLQVIRPADANETAQAWRAAVQHDGPTALVLSRQAIPVVTDGSAVDPGAGVVRDTAQPAVVLVGTGSEVAVCVEAADRLAADGVAARVVSMPSWDRFAARATAEQAAVLPPGVPVVSVEAAVTFGWSRWASASVGIDRFGSSAPGNVVLHELGIEPANVAATAADLLR
jgi:transketolase